MSKAKKCIIFIFIVLIMAAVYILCGNNVSSSLTSRKYDANSGSWVSYNGTDAWDPDKNTEINEFFEADDVDLLGVTYLDTYAESGNGLSFFRRLVICGKGSCWNHTGSNDESSGTNLRIHSVYTAYFDESLGTFAITSVMAGELDTTTYTFTTNSKTSEDGRVTKSAYNNYLVAALITNMQYACNSGGIMTLLANCYDAGYVVKASELAVNLLPAEEGDEYRKAGTQENDSTGKYWNEIENIYNSMNRLEEICDSTKGSNLINIYMNFKELRKYSEYNTKVNDTKPAETETMQINSKNYIGIGQFRMIYDGKNISSITVNTTIYTPDANGNFVDADGNYLYYCVGSASKAKTADNYEVLTTSNLMSSKINEGKKFWLAVPDSIIDDVEEYDVTFTQEKFNYDDARITITSGSLQQEFGVYDVYDSKDSEVGGEITWHIEANRDVTLVIHKYRREAEEGVSATELSGGLFKIYAEGLGWVQGEVDGEKTYVSSADKASEYTSGEEIKHLQKAKYYVYETKAVDGNYGLDNQDGYKCTQKPGYDSISGEYAYIVDADLSTWTGIADVWAPQNEYGSLQIEKYDYKSGESLTNVGFRIYVNSDNSSSGWLKGDADGEKELVQDVNEATEYIMDDETLDITKLIYGEYYIYETKTSGIDYNIEDQDGYLQTTTADGKTTLKGTSDLSAAGIEWAFIGMKDIDYPDEKINASVRMPQKKAATMNFVKTDTVSTEKLEGAEFKIYAELDDGTSGWLTGDADGVKEYTATTAAEAQAYSAEEIKNLRYGEYYIYETKAPTTDNNYVLADQGGGYMQTKRTNGKEIPGVSTFTESDEWVYLGLKTLNENTGTIDVPLENIPEGSIIIGGDGTTASKVDSITGEALTGEEFAIYAILDETGKDDVSGGWLSNGEKEDDLKQYVSEYSSASKYSSGIEISRLRYGTYYIYETKAPTTDNNYVLEDQDGYLQEKDESGNELPGVSDLQKAGVDYVYIYSVTVNEDLVVGQKYTLNNPYATEKVPNNELGSLYIGENGDDDGDTGKIDSVTTESLTGAEFKIYAVLDTEGLDKISEGWVSGEADDEDNLKQYVEYSKATAYSSGVNITRLRYGTYYIYETKSPNDNYDLKDQDNYQVTSDEDGEAKGYKDFGKDEDWVYVGQVTVNKETIEELYVKYKKIEPIATGTKENDRKGQIQIEKVDEEYNILKLEGAEFVIYAELDSDDIDNGWVSGDASEVKKYETSYSEASTYASGEDGLTDIIEKLNYGTYYIFETKTPYGYDITKQDYYKTTPSNVTVPVTPDAEDWVYVKTVVINKEELETLYNTSLTNGGEEYLIPPTAVQAANVKKVNELEGMVWLDKEYSKLQNLNYLYKEVLKDVDEGDVIDQALKDIEVRLYVKNDSGNYERIATTTTNDDGTYKFIFDKDQKNSKGYCETEVTYWQLVTAYVEFVYDNQEYIVVDPFKIGSNTEDNNYVEINSKAQEYEMDAEELEDENLTGTTGTTPGLAVTYRDATTPNPDSLEELNEILNTNSAVISGNTTTEILNTTTLAGYYQKDENSTHHYKVSNINLGLIEQTDPSYEVTETLAYSYITINGYSYIYYYNVNESGDPIEYENGVPWCVNQQLNAVRYSEEDTVSIYASDVISTINAKVSDMKLYLVYQIYVYNSEKLEVDDIYYEEKLYITSLTNSYDSYKMTLSKDNSDGDSQYVGSDQFGLWSTTDGTTATYNLNNDSGRFTNGIEGGGHATTYIQFQVTEQALTTLLDGSDEEIQEMNSKEASTTYTSGFHEYRRTDNIWHQTEEAEGRWYTEHREDEYEYTNDESDPYYIHKSLNLDKDTSSLFARLQLTVDEIRTITGTVYEDESKEENNKETGVGNGIIDDNENNRAYGVEVELLEVTMDSSGNIQTQTARLYALDENGKDNGEYPEAKTTTDISGNYSFEGVIPGYYLIQYTYGDGTQKIVDADGNTVDDLTSNDYRSTIVNTSDENTEYIQQALEELIDDSKIAEYITNLQAYYNNDSEEYDETKQKVLEWYKQLSSETSYNIAVDDISDGSSRDVMNSYTYTSQGVYNEEGELIATYELVTEDGVVTDVILTGTDTDADGNSTISFPLNVTASSPLIAISIENENAKASNADVKYNDDGIVSALVHESTFDEFNFGVIKQKTEISIDKLITNVSIADQIGNVKYSGNPATDKDSYVSALDEYDAGSKYARAEFEETEVYGSSVEIEYTVTITNNSAVAYDSAYWFKYGIAQEGDTESTVTINEIVDMLDKKYIVDSLLKNEEISQVLIESDGTEIEVTENVKIADESDHTEITNNYTSDDYTSIYFKDFKEITSGESIQITYRVTSSAINSDDDSEFKNNVQITSLSLSGVKDLNTDFVGTDLEWPSDSTMFVITPSTGGDQRNVYFVAGAIALLAVAGGIVLLKKKILK